MTGNNLKDNELPEEDHVVHYVGPKHFQDGVVNGAKFRLRPQDTGLSVNWLEYFGNHTKAEQLDEVSRLLRPRLTIRKSGCLAELNVGATKQHLRHKLNGLRFINTPRPATNGVEADPSHSEIMGLPPGDSELAAIVSDMIAKKCITNIYPAGK